METKESQAIIKDLIHIINDRISGFETVEGKIWERYPDIKPEYENLIYYSKIMKNELINLLPDDDDGNYDETSVKGDLHRAWIDVKSALTPQNTVNSTLENVLFGEKAVTESYENALKNGIYSDSTQKLLNNHLSKIKESYDTFSEILKYRRE